VDASTVVATVIKLQTALRLELLPAITVVAKATFLVIALKRPRPSLATNAAKKVIFLVTAHNKVTAAAVEDTLAAVAKSATVAERPVTLRVLVPRAVRLTVAVAAAVEADSLLSTTVTTKRLATLAEV